jgi:hypothetical protein
MCVRQWDTNLLLMIHLHSLILLEPELKLFLKRNKYDMEQHIRIKAKEAEDLRHSVHVRLRGSVKKKPSTEKLVATCTSEVFFNERNHSTS